MKPSRAGDLRAHEIGTDIRLKSDDVFDYRARFRARPLAAFDDFLGFEDVDQMTYRPPRSRRDRPGP